MLTEKKRSKAAHAVPAAPDLAARSEPVQERAIRSRAHILAVGRALLGEVGLDAFNTNLLAERADVRVRTIYRYFPNKLAVIAAIGEELIGKWANWESVYFDELVKPTSDWRALLVGLIGEWFGVVVRENGSWAVLQAMNAIPELRELDRVTFSRIAASWEAAIRARAPDAKTDVTALSYGIVSTFYGFIDSYMRVPEAVREQIPEQLHAMITARLGAVFNDGGQDAAR
ncbi:MAG: TetR/AcrR family transcriptional regulator [Candidatus Andeanibacterium colombiense]|uniref:TetR/AcrR family transcriptional regulator n=1 Tax=Candidatus Andeanibacterium colombiense TaxID=3121345 RepID=A0AAJ5X956_9SPHN|nr:MAG: TetR/AcrR family transcriptional regulator [Sphingomonadaceae bacterium]